METSAVISDCQKYRYCLRRSWPEETAVSGKVLFVMLNPSTADASVDDPTIRRCIGFAQSWGFAELMVANLYAFRATQPSDLWLSEDPVGPDNDSWLDRLTSEADKIVCAWGSNARDDRVDDFRRRMQTANTPLTCLGTTKAGAPRHPLYIRKTQPLEPWPSQPISEGK
jgi:hypothetical protein